VGLCLLRPLRSFYRRTPFIGVSVSLSESATARFTLLEGEPRWTRPEPLRLTYSITPTAAVDYYLPFEAARG
jgi:hypothetical protein